MRQAISQYIKPIKHSQQMQILEQCKTKAYNRLTMSKGGRSYGNCIVEDFGFDLSSVTRAFYRQIVREQRIPLTLEYPTPNLESREAIRETKELIASGDPGYATVSEMFEAMGA